jgi:hypothetical protein
VRRALLALALLAVAAGAPASGANFNHRSKSTGAVTTASVTALMRLFSQGTDPAGLTGYATKTSSSPAVPAATGADTALSVAAGGHKNDPGSTLTRVLTLQARNPLPAGVSSLTISATLAADAATGRQPISGLSFSPISGSPTSATTTLAAGQKAQLNLSLRLKNNEFPGNNTMYTPKVLIRVQYPGYTGSYFTYTVPVLVWDGNGAGP